MRYLSYVQTTIDNQSSFLSSQVFLVDKRPQLPQDIPVPTSRGCQYNHVELKKGDREEEDDAALHSSYSGAEAMLDRTDTDLSAMRNSEFTDTVGPARGNCATE